MAKIDSLAPIANISGAPTAAENALNTNFESITEAFQNTLSRDGSIPNEMQAELDMNSYHIINSPDAVDPQDLVPLHQMEEFFEEFIITGIHGGNGIVVSQNTPVEGEITIDANLVSGIGVSVSPAVGATTISHNLVAGAGVTLMPNTPSAGQLTIASSAGTGGGDGTNDPIAIISDILPQFSISTEAEDSGFLISQGTETNFLYFTASGDPLISNRISIDERLIEYYSGYPGEAFTLRVKNQSSTAGSKAVLNLVSNTNDWKINTPTSSTSLNFDSVANTRVEFKAAGGIYTYGNGANFVTIDATGVNGARFGYGSGYVLLSTVESGTAYDKIQAGSNTNAYINDTHNWYNTAFNDLFAQLTTNGLYVGTQTPLTFSTPNSYIVATSTTASEVTASVTNGSNNPRAGIWAATGALGLNYSVSSGVLPFEFARNGTSIFRYNTAGVEIVSGKNLVFYSPDHTEGATLARSSSELSYNDSEAHVFQVGGVEQMRITSSGVSFASGAQVAKSCRATNSSTSIPDGTATKVLFDAETYDDSGFFTVSSGNFIVPSGLGGLYNIVSSLQWSSATGGARLAEIRVNGTTTAAVANEAFSSYNTAMNISDTLKLSVGDSVSVYVTQNSGSGSKTLSSATISFTRLA